MKRIHIIRHAKSSWANPGQSDFDRPLNNRGLQNAPEMAARLKSRVKMPDLLICSPAARTKATAVFFCEAFHYPPQNIRYEKRIYEAPLKNLLDVIHTIPDTAEEILFIGHNNGVSMLVEYLSGEWTAMPTCAVATIDLYISAWKECTKGCGRLTEYDYPKKHD